MRGLTVILAAPDQARFRTALGLAAAQAALGGQARLFLDGPAVALIGARDAEDDARHAVAGLPTIAELIETAIALGVVILLCQTGMARAGLALDAIDLPVEASGLVALLSDLGEDRLLAL